MNWHPRLTEMLRRFLEDPRTPEHLRPNRLMCEAADHIEALEKELAALKAEKAKDGY